MADKVETWIVYTLAAEEEEEKAGKARSG